MLVTVDDYNRRAIAALQKAQHISGARSAHAFAQLLADRGGGSPSPSTYRRWISGEALIPAWALEVAAETAGATVHALLEGAQPTGDEWRTNIEQAIARLDGEITELRQHLPTN